MFKKICADEITDWFDCENNDIGYKKLTGGENFQNDLNREKLEAD